MPRSVLPVEDCVFRLDYRDGYRQAFPMTFNNVGLSEDGFEFVDGSRIDTAFKNTPYPEITLEVVIIPTIVDGSFQMFFGNYSGSGQYVNMYVDSLNKIRIQTRDKNDVTTFVQSDFSIEAGIEYHVMGVIDNDSMYMYLNGEKQVDIGIVEIQQYSTNPMFLGAQNSPTAYQFYGNMKLASIYNRALTPQEVSDRYNQSTFLFLNDTPTPTQQAYLDWQDSRIIGRSR